MMQAEQRHRTVGKLPLPRGAQHKCVWRGKVHFRWSLALATISSLLSACSMLRPPFDVTSRGLSETLRLPPSVHATLQRKRFQLLPSGEARKPTKVWWCVRPVNIPAGRMAAAVGWYHEWILAPGFEKGADFAGSDSVRGTWPPSPLALLQPLHANEHKGAALAPETYAREIRRVSPQLIRKAAANTPHAGFFPFPFHNCNTWVRKVIRKACTYENQL
ncbi:MAG: hypothetical protein ACP5QZ_08315 [Candidatus Sumerlaeaceae bacterium]